ncbi:MAG: hypothetical protein ACKN9T_14330 [Candidatus Methylumidiphilus sp.]
MDIPEFDEAWVSSCLKAHGLASRIKDPEHLRELFARLWVIIAREYPENELELLAGVERIAIHNGWIQD